MIETGAITEVGTKTAPVEDERFFLVAPKSVRFIDRHFKARHFSGRGDGEDGVARDNLRLLDNIGEKGLSECFEVLAALKPGDLLPEVARNKMLLKQVLDRRIENMRIEDRLEVIGNAVRSDVYGRPKPLFVVDRVGNN